MSIPAAAAITLYHPPPPASSEPLPGGNLFQLPLPPQNCVTHVARSRTALCLAPNASPSDVSLNVREIELPQVGADLYEPLQLPAGQLHRWLPCFLRLWREPKEWAVFMAFAVPATVGEPPEDTRPRNEAAICLANLGQDSRVRGAVLIFRSRDVPVHLAHDFSLPSHVTHCLAPGAILLDMERSRLRALAQPNKQLDRFSSRRLGSRLSQAAASLTPGGTGLSVYPYQDFLLSSSSSSLKQRKAAREAQREAADEEEAPALPRNDSQ